ncbi:MAG: DNA gyrase subunit A [Faecalibacterium sp.]|jgi:DNA gyrase subunit A|nr:DNA gyrase subunit A [Faecalibacterium sp.]
MEEDFVMVPGTGTKKIVRDVKKEIETAFLDYSMSVIVARALPDVRDGLKPVHRRILYTMHERGNDPSHPYRKSADTVGAVLGSYHPHGDASVYDAMVRLAQDFSLRYPLVDGQGNFGSVDGDPPAAYRYTEARMSKIAVEMLTDIDKDTINWDPNFDETKKEPNVLPARFPNLLCNGSQGIAVGMATNIPPHNLCEVVDGAIALIDNPDIDLAGLMEYIKGPDFPTAGIIMGRSGIRAAYATGRGKITLRGRATIEEKKNGRYQIIITEIPYMVNKARLIENIADLVKDKRIEGISDLNDETNRKGMRIVVEIKKEANPQVVLNQLYQFTQLQDTVGVIMLAIDHKIPKILTLKQMLQRYVEFQDEVIRRRTEYDLKKAEERAHILEGLKRATDIVDDLIATIRACKGGIPEAKQAIMDKFGFDDPQADAIVKLQLGRLAGLEILKIEQELNDLEEKIKNWKEILADDAKVLEIVKNELLDMKKRFGDERRTDIEAVSGEVDIEDLIPEEQCVFTLTHAGYIKRTPKATYQVQHRGGRGIAGLSHKEEDVVEELFIGSTHDYVLFVTNLGRIFRLKGYQIAEGSRTSKGTNIINLLQLQDGEKVTTMLCQQGKAGDDAGFVTMVTKHGLIKRTPLAQYANIRKSGLNAIALNEGDQLAWTRLTTGSDMLIVATKFGQAIRFNEANARPMGRMGHGVRAIRLAEGDEVIGVCICRDNATLFTVTEGGKGRRSQVDDYRITARGGKGIRNYDKSKDYVAGVKILDDADDIILISQEGILIRMHAEDINIQSRYGSGVRVMRLGEGDKVAVLARTDHDDEAETEKPEENAEGEELTPEELAEIAAEEKAQEAEEEAKADAPEDEE